jgi:uncharacterized membrane protein
MKTHHLRTFSRVLLGIAFVIAGANHFRDPATYIAMIPPWLPSPEMLNVISGAAEILGGVGVLIPRTRNAAGTGLILLLIAVFPANLHIALNGWQGMDIPRWVLVARLPFQLLFIAWVVFSCPGLPAYAYAKRILSSARIFRKP